MSLVTGVPLVRSRWTSLPLPREAQTQVESFGRKHNMPKTLTFGDPHGHEILDSLEDIVEWSDDDDDTNELQEDPDMVGFSYDDDVEEVDDITNNNIPTQPSTSEDTDNHENAGVNGVPVIDDTMGEITGEVGDLEASSESSETTGVEQHVDADETIGVDHDEELEDSDHDNTEEAKYEKAEQLGIQTAHDDDGTIPKCIRKKGG